MLSSLYHEVWSRRLLVVSLAFMLLIVGGLASGNAILAAGEPNLSISSNIAAYEGLTVSVPVSFTNNGSEIASTAFSLDFDQSCLAFDPTDEDQDGIPDAITFNFLPPAFNSFVSFNGDDTDGELDLLIGDLTPPLEALPDGIILAIVEFTTTCQPTVIAPVEFSSAPPASFGDTGADTVSGTVTDGSVEIVPPPEPVVQIDQIIPNPSYFDDIVEFNGGGITTDITKTVAEYEWTLIAVDESCGASPEPLFLGDAPRLLINSIAAGTHQVCLRAKNIADVWSDYVTTTMTVHPERFATSDIAISREGISFWKDAEATIPESNPTIGDQVYIKVRVDNIDPTHDTPDEVSLFIHDGKVLSSTLLVTDTIDFIAKGSNAEVIIPWTVGLDVDGNSIPNEEHGYKVLTVDIEYTDNVPYFANDPVPPWNEPHIERHYDNNQATSFIVVGEPSAEKSDILVTADIAAVDLGPDEEPGLQAGRAAKIVGDAHYTWGSQLPMMGAKVTIEIMEDNGDPHGVYHAWTTAPFGRYISRIDLPSQPGNYSATIKVSDHNLRGTAKINFTVLEAHPRPDLDIERFSVNLASPMVYQRSWNQYTFSRVYPRSGLFGVLNEPITITAKVRNRSQEQAAVNSFEVSFYDGTPTHGTLLGTKTVAGLAPDSSRLVSLSWTPTHTGTYAIQVVVDEPDENDQEQKGVVMESNEQNNYDEHYYDNQAYYNQSVHRDIINIREAKPDLRALELSYEAEPNLGDVIPMTVELHNLGHADITSGQPFTVTVYDGYPNLGVTDTRVLTAALELGPQHLNGPINQGDVQTLDIVWNTNDAWTEPGLHHLCVEVDTGGEIDESFEENNVNCWNLYVFPNEVDLWPVALSFSNTAPLPNTPINIMATLRNMGAIELPATDSGTLTFYLGDPSNNEVIGSATFNGSIAGRRGTTTVSIPWTTSDSPRTAYIYVEYIKDYGHQLGSRSYVRKLNIYPYPPPNLRIRSGNIHVSGSGSERTVSAEITNVASSSAAGTTTASDFTVNFYTDSPNAGLQQLGATLTVGSLAPGETTTVVANAPLLATEPYYVIKADAMPRVEQGDANYGDNEATRSIGINFIVDNDSPTVLCGTTTFTAEVPDEAGVRYDWDFGDGVKSLDNDGRVTHVYESPGDYTATVTTRDHSPQLTSTIEVTVEDTDCLIWGLKALNNGPAPIGDQTTVEAKVTRGDNITYTWDFGDGSDPVTGTEAKVSHTYPAVGTYIVTVSASNSVSSEVTATTEVTITKRWGDANGDNRVNAADISALVKEIFDGDGSDPADTPGGTYPGTPSCDANKDGIVSSADISCIVRILFEGQDACKDE